MKGLLRSANGCWANDAASVGFLHVRLDILSTARPFAALALSTIFVHRNIFLATIRRYAAIR
jgi:hypothetical protein